MFIFFFFSQDKYLRLYFTRRIRIRAINRASVIPGSPNEKPVLASYRENLGRPLNCKCDDVNRSNRVFLYSGPFKILLKITSIPWPISMYFTRLKSSILCNLYGIFYKQIRFYSFSFSYCAYRSFSRYETNK